MPHKYKISVITPIHNVDLNIFKRAFESMKAQTFGFDNIEWLVVVHNSPKEYQEEIKNLLGDFENVKIHILNNDAHTPSSPRNYALDYATGDYVGFLDGDDKYTPECIKTALNNIISSGADICAFRREVELEAESHLILNEIVLWDQTQERIIVNKHTWDDKKIFNVIWGMVTSKLYRREFLNKHNLRFDEDIFFAEDFALNVRAYGLAENICLLPQLIGYVYFVNGASLVQSVNLSNEKLIAYAEGFKKIFDTGLNFGFNMNDVMHNLLTHEALLILNSKIITNETRNKIRELLAPYVKMLTPLPPSKLYSDQRRKELLTFPQVIINEGDLDTTKSFISYRRQPAPVTVKDYQALALKIILENGEHSDYGQRYQFENIMTMEGYSSRLPLTDYDVYEPMIRLTARIAESGIFTDNKITSYALQHGIMGKAKRLPFTDKHLKFYVDEFRNMIRGKKIFLMLESLPYHSSGLDLDNTYTNTILGLILSELYKNNLTAVNPKDRLNIINPVGLMFPNEILNADYPRLFFALRERDLDVIFAPNSWILLDNLAMMFEHWQQLCDDIEFGRISECDRFPESLRAELNTRITPDKARADELRSIDIYSEHAMKKIWPSLKKFVCNYSGDYEIYLNGLRKHIYNIPIENTGLAVDEVFAGSVYHDDKFKLCLTSAFYEFASLDNNAIFYAHQLEQGVSYRLIVSTLAGLYRYKTNIIIKAEELTDKYLIFSTPGRQHAFYGGIREDEVYNAVKVFERELNLEVRDFVFFQDDEDDDYYDFMLELPYYENLELDRAELSRTENIISDMLNKKVRIMFNEPKTHILYRDMLQYKLNVLPDAINPVHVTDSPRTVKFFKSRIMQDLFIKE